MRSSLLVCALGILAGCDNGDDPGSSGTPAFPRNDSGGSRVDADNDGYDSTEDCDDERSAVNPGATEVCDQIDNNCVDGVDEGVTTPFYADTDADTYGSGAAVDACTTPKDYVANADDCDDTTAAVNPGATEVCDGIDNNCAGGIDDGVTTLFYADGDSDGYGAAVDACSAPPGLVDNADDCDDTNADVNPSAIEVCDWIDNDCDTDVDDDDDSVTGGSTYYPDADGDGYGDSDSPTTACEMPSGYVTNNWDCDDTSRRLCP